MIEVFQGDDFTLEFEMTDGIFPNDGSYLCAIVNDMPKQTPNFEVFDLIPSNTNKIKVNLSAKNLTPSKKYAPFKWYIRFTLRDNNLKQTTVLQEELYVKELHF
jgi:hypothetical protein